MASDETWMFLTHIPSGINNQTVQQRSIVWAENAAIAGHLKSPSPVHFSTLVRKQEDILCLWHFDSAKKDQKEFCQTYDGYPELCNCLDPITPETLRYSSPSIEMYEEIPLAMLTAIKPYHFYRQLLNVLKTKGASQTPIYVFIDDFNEEIFKLASLFRLPIALHKPQGFSHSRLNTHFKFSVYNIFQSQPRASKAIILEDDLLLSPDFFVYFHSSAWLLDADPSIYCINAFSINSISNVASDVTRLKRVSSQPPQFGWLIRKKWAEKQIPLWVPENSQADWDWWLALSSVKKDKDVIIPEISRTFHAGSAGSHVTGWEQAFYYDKMIYNEDAEAVLQNIDRLHLDFYDSDLREEISHAKMLHEDFNPCSHTPIPERNGPYKVYLKVESNLLDSDEFTIIAMCLHAHYEDGRDFYKGIQIYNIKNRRLFIIGCPLSPFCPLNERLHMLSSPLGLVSWATRIDANWRQSTYLTPVKKRIPTNTPEQEFQLSNLVRYNRTFSSEP